MLSGNGRHRRPRQAPALLVAAGVTGSAIAIPLLGATGASAATGTTWDRVAECESGGSWSENSANGYYGGLQLSQDDWEKYGGLEYAETADQASRSQQIAVAEKILKDQGVGAFHTCGLLSGLTKDSHAAGVDTGVGDSSSGLLGSSDSSGSGDTSDSSGLTDSSEESSGKSSSESDTSDSSGSSDSAASPGASASSSTGDSSDATGDSTKAEKSDNSDKSAKPSPSDPGSGTGDAQGSDSSPTDSPADSGESDNYQQSAGISNLVDTGSLTSGTGRHRGKSADEAPSSYTVHAGDSLKSIADSLELDGGWRALYAENKKAIGADPNRIVPGQTLDLPAE